MKNLYVCFFIALLSSGLFAQGSVIYQKTFGGTASENGRAIEMTSDGGFIITGYTYSNSNGMADLLLIKTDSLGNAEWEVSFGDSGMEWGNDVIETNDGGFAAVGFTSSTVNGDRDVYLVRVDGQGNLLSEQTFGGDSTDEASALLQTSDGTLHIAGTTFSYTNGMSDVYHIVLPADGGGVVENHYGGEKADWANGMCLRTGGGVFIVGGTGSVPAYNNMDLYFIAIDETNTLLWDGNYHYRVFDSAYDVLPKDDGTYLVTGICDNEGSECLEAFTLLIDSVGNNLKMRRYGMGTFYDYASTVLPDMQGGYYVVGGTRSLSTYETDVFVCGTDDDAIGIWKDSLGGDGNDFANDAVVLEDGTIVLCGYTYSYGAGAADVWLVKVSGTPVGVEDEEAMPDGFGLLQNYPNPFNPATKISFTIPSSAQVKLTVYSSIGENIAVLSEGFMSAGLHTVSFSGEGLQSGVYFYKLEAGEYTAVKKMMLLK